MLNKLLVFIDKLQRLFKSYQRLVAQYADEDAIFIYQMGKVGSTTLENSLPNAVHVHAFYNRNHTCPVRLKGLAKFGAKHLLYRAEQEFRAWLIRCTIKRRKHTKVITLVRDPMARNISMFFHDIDAYLYSAHTNCDSSRAFPLSTRHQDMQLLETVFEQEFDHTYPLTWFERELKVITQLDIYKAPFNTQLGFSKMKNNKFSVMCIRVDKLSRCLDYLSEFTGKEITLINSNEAQSKWYGELYHRFKQSYQPSSILTSQIIESRYYQHFFKSKYE